MKTSEQKRFEYWNHFIARWIVEGAGGGFGVTGPKLQKIKAQIMEDDEFWTDIVIRHNGIYKTPERMREMTPATYDHCLGNFWGMIYQTLTEEGLIK